MSPIGDIILALDNYSCGIAAAFLVVALAVVRILLKKYPPSGDAALEVAFVRVCMSAARIIRYSICGIVVTGIPMAFFLKGRGLSAQGDLQGAAAAVRYAVMLFLSGIALFSWSRLLKKVGRLKSKRTIDD
jgi:hypothetical protein